ncbi:MAG: carbon-nitrogen hydrolase family protein [Clostridia bacterium]|nr:carbon-nitrogen hydrolase family protein [Clostridia bacterium]
MIFSQWTLSKNYPAVDGDSRLEAGRFRAILPGDHYRLTNAVAICHGFTQNGRYRLTFDLHTDPGIKSQIIYSWYTAAGDPIFRAHAVSGEEIPCPEGAEALEMNVCFFGTAAGEGSISNVAVEYLGAYVPNRVKLAAIMGGPRKEPTTQADNILAAGEKIDAAAKEGADLVLLCELYNAWGVTDMSPGEGARITAPAVTMLRDKAKEHGIFVAASVKFQDENGLLSNTILLYDRKGELVGRYDKSHITMRELWSGTVPGDDLPVFDTELGRIGCAICWDRFMPEIPRLLFLKGVDIVLNPTASDAYALKNAHSAYPNAMIFVTAQVTDDPEITRIEGRRGQILATADPEKGYAIAEVDVNAYDPVYWLSAPAADTDPRSVYRHERRPEMYSDLSK